MVIKSMKHAASTREPEESGVDLATLKAYQQYEESIQEGICNACRGLIQQQVKELKVFDTKTGKTHLDCNRLAHVHIRHVHVAAHLKEYVK